MYEALISDLQERLENFPADGFSLDYCRIRGACEAMEAMNEKLAALQSENAELKQWLDKVNDFEKSQCVRLLERLSRMKAERDAAIADISHVCPTCAQFQGGDCPVLFYKDYPKDCEHWRWRGVQGEG